MYICDYIGVTEGDTGSLDYGSYGLRRDVNVSPPEALKNVSARVREQGGLAPS